MGNEFGQWREWNHDDSLDWHLLDDPAHAGLRRYVQDAQLALPRRSRRSTRCDFEPAGFRWIDCNDNENSVVSFVRYARDRARLRRAWSSTSRRCRGPTTASACPEPGCYAELLNSDSAIYGGSNVGNGGGVATRADRRRTGSSSRCASPCRRSAACS